MVHIPRVRSEDVSLLTRVHIPRQETFLKSPPLGSELPSIFRDQTPDPNACVGVNALLPFAGQVLEGISSIRGFTVSMIDMLKEQPGLTDEVRRAITDIRDAMVALEEPIKDMQTWQASAGASDAERRQALAAVARGVGAMMPILTQIRPLIERGMGRESLDGFFEATNLFLQQSAHCAPLPPRAAPGGP